MGAFLSSSVHQSNHSTRERLHITGLGTQWPELLVGPEVLEQYMRKWYKVDGTCLEKLAQVNRSTGIRTKAVSNIWNDPLWNQASPPSVEDLDVFYRKEGVALATAACRQAIGEWGGSVSEITHVVAVTATNSGAPGYDQLVANSLGVSQTADRVLLSGIGCAGGLAAMRVAANMAICAEQRGQPARVLVFACEVCSAQVRSELEYAKDMDYAGIGPALFGDGAAAFVLCNGLAPEIETRGVYSLLDWTTAIVPGTSQEMSYRTTSFGFLLHLSRNVPQRTAQGLKMAYELLVARSGRSDMTPHDMDWALHPGGLAILKAAQVSMDLTEDSLRASFDIYQTRGNSSSVAVLATLDKLRSMGEGKDDVMACSFGPGLTVEAALMKRMRKPGKSQ